MNCIWLLILLFCCGNNNGRMNGCISDCARDAVDWRNRSGSCNNNDSRNCTCEREGVVERERSCEQGCSRERERERECGCGCENERNRDSDCNCDNARVEARFDSRPFMSFGNSNCGCEASRSNNCDCR